jgi:hypothetical protein
MVWRVYQENITSPYVGIGLHKSILGSMRLIGYLVGSLWTAIATANAVAVTDSGSREFFWQLTASYFHVHALLPCTRVSRQYSRAELLASTSTSKY